MMLNTIYSLHIRSLFRCRKPTFFTCCTIRLLSDLATEKGPTLIKFRFNRIGISLFDYTLAVQLPFLKRQHVRTGRMILQQGVNYSLILNLNSCRKRKLNPERISLHKRKAQHRKKRIQRKKHDAKVKNSDSPVHRVGLLFTPLLGFGLGQQYQLFRFSCMCYAESLTPEKVVVNFYFTPTLSNQSIS